MRTAALAVIASLLCLACATTSQRASIADLHYTIDNDVLRFEHDGAMYVVSDPLIVQQASSAAKDLYFSLRGVDRGRYDVPAGNGRYDAYTRATTGSAGLPPVQEPTAANREESQAYVGLMNESMGFAEDEAEAQLRRRDFDKKAAHAAKRLQEIFDRSVSGGLAQRVD